MTPDTADTITPPLPADLPDEVQDGNPDAGDPHLPISEDEMDALREAALENRQ